MLINAIPIKLILIKLKAFTLSLTPTISFINPSPYSKL
jgi:hypothetical protein